EFTSEVRNIIREGYSIEKSCVNNAKVSDHHAIIPTEEKPKLLKMTADEKKIYFMVVQRFLAAFYPKYRYQTVSVICKWEDDIFKSNGKIELEKGWRLVYDGDEEEDDYQNLPDLKKGDTFVCKNTMLKADKTKAPSRYTEASLLAVMENPSKYIEDKKMKEFIGGGLGTPATRADIIEKLYHSYYMENRDNIIHPTQKAMQLMDIVPSELKEPMLTAKWERELEAIAAGKADEKDFIKDIRSYATELVQTVKKSTADYKPDNLTRTPCPECGKMMLEVNGKHGKLLVCQDRECGYKKNVSRKTNVRCPECHKVMDMFGEGDKKMYICPCGFREKADHFHEKRKEQGGSKRDVRKFLDNQKEEQELSPLAKALQEAMKK
ncbi:MAG: DNA topoisomerase III, partial [Firmicutes bacterium]|nr:DNA topoisomerase III [Bacillota bacterium]